MKQIEKQEAVDQRYRKFSRNRIPCDSVAPALVSSLRAHAQTVRCEKKGGDQVEQLTHPAHSGSCFVDHVEFWQCPLSDFVYSMEFFLEAKHEAEFSWELAP